MSQPFYFRLRAFLRDNSGAMLVEAALVLPLMLLFMAVIIEMGRVTWIYQAASGGVRDASRYLARTSLVTPCPPTDLADLTTKATTFINNTFATTVHGDLAKITDVAVTASCVDREEGDPFRGNTALILRVSADVEITYIWGGVFGLVGAPLDKVTVPIVDESRVYGV
jgi:Flp pilus assembly protein TadG